MPKSYFHVAWVLASLCAIPSAAWADPANEPAVPAPVDTTPKWWRTMESPPVLINSKDAGAPLQEPAAIATPAGPFVAATEYLPVTSPSYVEAGMNYYSVTHNLGDTFGQFVNAQYQSDPYNRWSAGVQHASAFHDSGEAISVGNNHVWNADYFTDVGASLGSTASFLSRYRVDASLSRIWLDGRNLITTAGLTWDAADETYTDRTLHLVASYYFPGPWIAQFGVNINDSDPGNVIAPSMVAALTYGYQERYYLTGRYVFAREAYQIINSGSIQTSFNSQTFGLNWRQWVDDGWGFNLGTEYYTNPFYSHVGGTASIFKEF